MHGVRRIVADDEISSNTNCKVSLTRYPEWLSRDKSSPTPSEKTHAHVLPRRALNTMQNKIDSYFSLQSWRLRNYNTNKRTTYTMSCHLDYEEEDQRKDEDAQGEMVNIILSMVNIILLFLGGCEKTMHWFAVVTPEIGWVMVFVIVDLLFCFAWSKSTVVVFILLEMMQNERNKATEVREIITNAHSP